MDSSTLEMDFGTLGQAGESRYSLLQVHNPNPVPILVTDLAALQDGLDFAYLAQVREDAAPMAYNRASNGCLRGKPTASSSGALLSAGAFPWARPTTYPSERATAPWRWRLSHTKRLRMKS